MTSWIEELADHIDQPGIDGDPERDISLKRPGITREEALQVQLAVKRRHVAQGDRIIGHQASFTSAGVRKLFPEAPAPMVGTLLASLARSNGEEITLTSDEAFLECEIALILKRDLEGPDLTDLEIANAIDCYLPPIEIAPLRPGVRDLAYSYEHLIAVQKAPGGYVIFGDRRVPAHAIDPLLEGCLVSVDGKRLIGATGFEAMGGPARVIAGMARALSDVGEKLLAGQVIMTGSLPLPPVITRANRVASIAFANLGEITTRLA
jgi:2-keto-4-pentenoate hydratase